MASVEFFQPRRSGGDWVATARIYMNGGSVDVLARAPDELIARKLSQLHAVIGDRLARRSESEGVGACVGACSVGATDASADAIAPPLPPPASSSSAPAAPPVPDETSAAVLQTTWQAGQDIVADMSALADADMVDESEEPYNRAAAAAGFLADVEAGHPEAIELYEQLTQAAQQGDPGALDDLAAIMAAIILEQQASPSDFGEVGAVSNLDRAKRLRKWRRRIRYTVQP